MKVTKQIIICLSLAVLCTLGISAQEIVKEVEVQDTIQLSPQKPPLLNKKGKPILPAKGDIAIGISANGVLNYLGNMFNNTVDNEFRTSLLNNDLYLKYFVNERSAIRLKLGIANFITTRLNELVDDLDVGGTVTDKEISNYTSIDFSLGKEWRKGNGRLELLYGAEFLVDIFANNVNFKYGNEMTSTNPSPTTTVGFSYGTAFPTSDRIVKTKENSDLEVGSRLFMGVEYFVAPKLSIGTEAGISYYYTLVKRRTGSESETMRAGRRETEPNYSERRVSRLFTDFLSGQLYVLFHF